MTVYFHENEIASSIKMKIFRESGYNGGAPPGWRSGGQMMAKRPTDATHFFKFVGDPYAEWGSVKCWPPTEPWASELKLKQTADQVSDEYCIHRLIPVGAGSPASVWVLGVCTPNGLAPQPGTLGPSRLFVLGIQLLSWAVQSMMESAKRRLAEILHTKG